MSDIDSYLLRMEPELVCDSDDLDALTDTDALVITPPVRRSGSGDEFYLQAVQELVDSALAHRIPRIILTSSTSVYGDAQGMVEETTPRNPVVNSGRVSEGLEDWPHNLPGTSVGILRLAGLVGPGRHPGRLFAGKAAPDGGHGANLVHLENVTGAITLLLQAPEGGHIYSICAPARPARNVFYPQMARLLGLEPPQFRSSLDSGKGKTIDGSRICNELGFEHQYPDPLVMPLKQATTPTGRHMHCRGACMKSLLDALMILDVLEKEDSFAAASVKLYKTPSVLSYTVHKLESGLNIQPLDRSGHRAEFTRTGEMLLEKGREVLHTVRELEKQAVKLHEGWENELVIGVDDTFPFSLLVPFIETFYQRHSVTRLKFINGVLGGSWGALTQGRADIIVNAMHEPLSSSKFGLSWLGDLEQVFAVTPHHPLVLEEEPLNRRIIKRYRTIVVGDTAQAGASTASQLLNEQETITVFDFKIKLELQISGLGRGYLPRYLAQRFLDSGALIEKKVVAQAFFEPVWIGWNEQIADLANGWWRDEILANSAVADIYAKSDDGKSAI